MAPTNETANTIPVTVETFVRAETDTYFAVPIQQAGGPGAFHHYREVMPISHQTVVRANRDTLYSAAVIDLEAGPATVTLPDAGSRFLSMMVIDQDHYVPLVEYGAGNYELTREAIGTRYAMVGIRTLVNPSLTGDLETVHALQDAMTITQREHGHFEVPAWDQASQKTVRDALLVLGTGLPDLKGMFGARGQVDPIRHLIGSAMAWGGNPENEATYLNVTPRENDGTTIYRLTVRDVPVDGFWSISVYNAEGYYTANEQDTYTLNNITAAREEDGSIVVQFGGCHAGAANCLPIVPGWNYMVRLYRPHPEVLSGAWSFPEAVPVH
jgi:hypothetical protein